MISENDRTLIPITLFVIALHISLVYFFSLTPDAIIPSKPIQRLVVKTITLGELQKLETPVLQKTSTDLIAEVPAEILDQQEHAPVEEEKIVEEISEKLVEETTTVKEIPALEEPPKQHEVIKEEPVKNETTKVEPIKKAPEKKVEKISKPTPKPTPKPKAKIESKKNDVVKKDPAKKPAQKIEKPIAQKIETPKIDPAVEEAKAKQKALLAKAQESIAKINKNRDNLVSSKETSSTAKIPGQIQSMHIDAMAIGEIKNLNSEEIGYRDELAGRLKLFLKLPEYGEVKIKLTLERSGKVSKIVIETSESALNRKYIEKTIPTLTFPPFNNNFGSLSQYTFLISLSNDY